MSVRIFLQHLMTGFINTVASKITLTIEETKSDLHIVIFLPNYIVVLLTKSIHVTVNNIIIQQNAI